MNNNKVNIVNGSVVGVHLGTPMQDATPTKPEDNLQYATERNTVTRIGNSEATWDDQPMQNGGSGSGSADFDAFIEGREFAVTGNAVSVAKNAFIGNSKVIGVDLPNATVIDERAFYGCEDLTSVELPKLQTLGSMAFMRCGIDVKKRLKTMHLPLLKKIYQQAFYECYYLETIDFPLVEDIGSSAFQHCQSLVNVNLPMLKSTALDSFAECTSLEVIDLPNCYLISSRTFEDCVNLKSIILRQEDDLFFISPDAILNTKIATSDGTPTGEGFIYIPTSRYEENVENFILMIFRFAESNDLPIDEPTATYIATAILRKLEDYTVDGTTTGELDEGKI